MKRWPAVTLMFVATLPVVIIMACAPDPVTDPGVTLTHRNPTSIYSYEYLCETGDPNYSGYCEDFGSLGSGGIAWQACPGALANDTQRCHIWDATLDALMNSGDATCVDAAMDIAQRGDNFTFYDTTLVDSKNGELMDAQADTTDGTAVVYATAFDHSIYNPSNSDAYDPDDPGPSEMENESYWVSYDLTVTFVHEDGHLTNHSMTDDEGDAVGYYCADVVRANEIAALSHQQVRLPNKNGPLPKLIVRPKASSPGLSSTSS